MSWPGTRVSCPDFNLELGTPGSVYRLIRKRSDLVRRGFTRVMAKVAIQALKQKHAAAIAHKDAMIRDKDAHIANLTAHIGNLDAVIAHERYSIQCHAQATVQRDAEITDLRARIAELARENKRIQDLFADTKRQLGEYLARARASERARLEVQAEVDEIKELIRTALTE